MAGNATVTGDIGPGLELNAVVIPGVEWFKLLSGQQMLELYLTNGQYKYIDIASEATITVTKVGTSYDITVAT